MEFISELPFVGGFLSSALGFLIVLGIVVSVHEYGHYIVGRWCGIHAEVFSLGFGKPLKTWYDKRGTKWQIAALPLGGYVKFLGDTDSASTGADADVLQNLSETERRRSFHGAALWRRSLTVAAGPVANFVLSMVIFAGLVMWTGVAVDEPVLGEVKDLPGQEAVLQTGDRVLEIEDQPVTTFGDITRHSDVEGESAPKTFVIERDGERMTLEVPYVVPPLVQFTAPLSAASAAGLKPGDLIVEADGKPLYSFGALQEAVLGSGGEPMTLKVRRGDALLDITLTPRVTEQLLPDGTIDKRLLIGISGGTVLGPSTYTPMPWEALWIGGERVVNVIDQSLTGIWHIIQGSLSAKNLQGPVGIAQLSGESASQGVFELITLIAVISTAIGLLNLFRWRPSADVRIRGDRAPAASRKRAADRHDDRPFHGLVADGVCNL